MMDMPVKMRVVSGTIGMNVGKAKLVYVGGNLYEGDYEVIPSAKQKQVLETAQKIMSKNVTVHKIPYSQTSNLSGGDTVYIGGIDEITTN